MDAILWDGQKQIKGKLEFGQNAIHFDMIDFEDTDLDLHFNYSKIKEVNYHKVFGIAKNGIEIITNEDTRNIFIVEDIQLLKESIENIITIKNT